MINSIVSHNQTAYIKYYMGHNIILFSTKETMFRRWFCLFVCLSVTKITKKSQECYDFFRLAQQLQKEWIKGGIKRSLDCVLSKTYGEGKF